MWLRHGHVVFELSIVVVQKATAPKNGAEFCQGSIGTIRSSLDTSYDVWQRRHFSTKQRPRNYLTLTKWHRINILSGPALRAAPAKISSLTLMEAQNFNRWAVKTLISSFHKISPHFINILPTYLLSLVLLSPILDTVINMMWEYETTVFCATHILNISLYSKWSLS